MVKIDGNRCHEVLIDKMKPELSFDPSKDYGAWREKVREKLLELLGMERIEANACELKMQIERDEQKDGYRLIRFVFVQAAAQACKQQSSYRSNSKSPAEKSADQRKDQCQNCCSCKAIPDQQPCTSAAGSRKAHGKPQQFSHRSFLLPFP